MAARALSHLLSSGTAFSRTSTFYEFAQKSLSLSEDDVKKACTELIIYGAPLSVLGAPSDVIEDAAATALLCQAEKYMHLADHCPLDARPRILAKAAIEAFCKNDLNGMNTVGVKIEEMQSCELVYQSIADGIHAWLLSERRALAFYTRTNLLLTRFHAQKCMNTEARAALFYACIRGGVFHSRDVLLENMKQLKLDAVDPPQVIEAICASGRSKLLEEYLEFIEKKPDDVPKLLGSDFERVLNHAAAHGKTSILRMLVNEKTPAEQLYQPAVCAVRNEQVRVVKLVFQWSRTHSELKEIAKGVSALLSHHGTSSVYYNKADTRLRLRGILRVLGLGMLPEANALGESSWVRVFEGVNWDWHGESAEAEVQRQLLACFCAREMRVALRAAISVCSLEEDAMALLLPHLPCRTPTSLVMIEDMCGLSDCLYLDTDPETALRFLEYAGKQGILMGALRVAHMVTQDAVAALVATAVAERNMTSIHVYQLTNPSSVEAALLVHEESPEMQDAFHTWLHQRVPGMRWSPPFIRKD